MSVTDDLTGMAQSLQRIERRLVQQDERDAKRDERIDKLERVADQAMAVMQFVKWFVSLVGLAGIGTFLYALSQSARTP